MEALGKGAAQSPQSFSYARPAGSTESMPAGKSGMFETTQWRDLWVAIVFYVHLAGLVALSALTFVKAAAHIKDLPPDSDAVNSSIGTIVAIGAGMAALIAIILSTAGLAAMRRWPRPIIHAAVLSNAVVMGLFTVYAIAKGNGVGAIVGLISTALALVFYFVFRKRIPFSATILANVVDCFAAFPHMLTASLVAVLASIVYSSWVVATIGAAHALSNTDDKNFAFFAMIYTVFSAFWTQQVIGNVLQTTIAGVYATWYFLAGTGRMVANPTLGAARRALTYSFGSVCLGSLVVAVIQFMRFVLSIATDRDSIAGAIAGCLLQIIEDLARYFNYYAYTEIAIYGKPYMQAARDTVRLVKSHGVDAIVNDNFIGTATMMLSLAIGLVCAAVCGLLSHLTFAAADPSMSIVIAVLAFIVGFWLSSIVFQIVDAGATATFVCLAEDPGALRASRPAFFEAIRRSYPHATLGF